MAIPLISDTEAKIINSKVTADDVTVAASLAKVFTGDDETASGTMKKGDIFVKDDGTIYFAISTNPASGWQAVPVQS